MSNLNFRYLNPVFGASVQPHSCSSAALHMPFFLLPFLRRSTFIGQVGLYLIQAVSAAFYRCGKAWPFCLPPSQSPATCTLQISSGRRARFMALRSPAEELSGDRERECGGQMEVRVQDTQRGDSRWRRGGEGGGAGEFLCREVRLTKAQSVSSLQTLPLLLLRCGQ